MNIFAVSHDVTECAEALCDKHLNKMIVETCQMLVTGLRVAGFDETKLPVTKAGTYWKATHQNHPCNIWMRVSSANWIWAFDYLQELLTEYSFRYFKQHSCQESVLYHLWDLTFKHENSRYADLQIEQWVEKNLPNLGLTDFPQCMPDEFKVDGDSQKAYRNYYNGDRISAFAKWTNTDPPAWFTGAMIA
tara:strand:+ start:5361 stop:5930 length:570 start_codon:yes stop_codon:yes gene_type:complete